MPQTLWLVVGGGITEVAAADIPRVLGMRGVTIAADDEVAAHLDAQHRTETAQAAKEAVEASAPVEDVSAPAQSDTGASSEAVETSNPPAGS
jgi:hypothetical protein